MNLFRRICFSIFLFPIVFLALGILLIYAGHSEYWGYQAAQEVTAVVTHSSFDVESYGDTTEQRYRIYITYTFEGNTYSDVFWKGQSTDIAAGTTVSLKVSPSDPGKPYQGNPIGWAIAGVPLVLAGLFLSFKCIPHSFVKKEEFVYREERHTLSKKARWFVLVGLIPTVVFLILGLLISPFLHIGTIIFAYVTVVFAETVA